MFGLHKIFHMMAPEVLTMMSENSEHAPISCYNWGHRITLIVMFSLYSGRKLVSYLWFKCLQCRYMRIAVKGAVKCLKHGLSQAVALFHSAPLTPCDDRGRAVELFPALPQLPPLPSRFIFSQLITCGITKETLGMKRCNLTAIRHIIVALFYADHSRIWHICNWKSPKKDLVMRFLLS